MSTPISVSDAGTFTDTLLNGKFVTLTDSGTFRDLLVNGSGDYTAQVLADSPIAWWRMDETSGTVLADAAGSHPLNIVGSGTPTFGVAPITAKMPGTAIHYPGTLYAVDSGSTAWLDAMSTGSFSIEFLMRTTNQNCVIAHHGVNSGGSTQVFTIFNSGNSLLFNWTESTGSNRGQFWNGPVPFVADNSWHHYVVTFNAPTFVTTFYTDGKQTGSFTGAGLLKPNSGTPFTLGAVWAPGYGSIYSGDLDEFAIYPDALTADRVLSHYVAAIDFPYSLYSKTAIYSTGAITTSFAGKITTAGNLLTARVLVDSNSASVPTVTTPGGWTLDTSFTTSVISSPTLGAYIYSKTAVGGDSPPVFTTTGTVDGIAVLDEWVNSTNFAGSIGASYEGTATNAETAPAFTEIAGDVTIGMVGQNRSGSAIGNADTYDDVGYNLSGFARLLQDSATYSGSHDTLLTAHRAQTASGPYGFVTQGFGTANQLVLLAVGYGINSLKILDDPGTFDDQLIISTQGIDLEEEGFFDDEFAARIPGGPTIPLGMVDIDGRTDISARFAIDGIPYLALDFIDGRTDVVLSYIGPVFTRLDPIDGSTDVHLGIRATIFVYPDAIDGATDFELFLIPSDPGGGGQPLGEAGAQLNTPIGIAVALSGAIAVIPPAAI